MLSVAYVVGVVADPHGAVSFLVNATILLLIIIIIERFSQTADSGLGSLWYPRFRIRLQGWDTPGVTVWLDTPTE